MVVDHAMNLEHVSLDGAHHFNRYSSATFSLLCQTDVFGSQALPGALDWTDECFELENCMMDSVELINNNGGFTISGWYKRVNIADCDIIKT